jgi:predicted Zn-ribbon and HTH transcriptional regulator
MTLRRHLHELLTQEPRSVSSLARELGLGRKDLEADLQHLLRSAAARGERIEILPAKCKACGFEFGPERLAKPGRCPECKASRIIEAMIRLGGHGKHGKHGEHGKRQGP